MTWDPWCATYTCSQGGAAENSPNYAESKVAAPCKGAGVQAVRKEVFQNLVLASPQLPGPPDLGIKMEHSGEIADRKNLQQGEERILSGGIRRQWQRGFAKFLL